MVFSAVAIGASKNGTASGSIALGSTCANGGTATYTWTGFGGGKQVAIDVDEAVAPDFHHVITRHVASVMGSGGSFTVHFDLVNGNIYSADGVLYDGKGNQIPGAAIQLPGQHDPSCT
jgi:hypothetical protein